MPLWNPNPQADQTRKSRAAEERIAADLQGRRIPGSGAIRFAPGHGSVGADIRTERFLIEHKRTDTEAMVLQVDWLDQIRRCALRSGRDPVLIFEVQRDEPWVLFQPQAAREVLRSWPRDTYDAPVLGVRRTKTLHQSWLRERQVADLPTFGVSTPSGPWVAFLYRSAREVLCSR